MAAGTDRGSGERQAVVVGAGIGGLAAALALRQAGWAVTVLERAAAARELGFALLMAPNAMRALGALGLADTVRARGVVSTTGELRRPDGLVLRRLALGDRLRQALGEDTVCVLRPALHGTLLERLGAERVRMGSKVVGFVADERGVRVGIEGSRELGASLLIAADGIRSGLRSQLAGPRPLRYGGFTAWRGVARGVPQRASGLSAVQYLGRGVEAGLARAGPDSVYWFLAVRAPASPTPPADARAGLAEALAGFHEPFRRLVSATPIEDLRRDDLFDDAPLERWGEGPVTLLGDAAHPMLPNAGQGAAQALEDAVVLGRCLTEARDPAAVDAALRRYEQLRRPRTAAIVLLARRNARLAMATSPLAASLRDLLIRLVPDRVLLRRMVAVGHADGVTDR